MWKRLSEKELYKCTGGAKLGRGAVLEWFIGLFK